MVRREVVVVTLFFVVTVFALARSIEQQGSPESSRAWTRTVLPRSSHSLLDVVLGREASSQDYARSYRIDLCVHTCPTNKNPQLCRKGAYLTFDSIRATTCGNCRRYCEVQGKDIQGWEIVAGASGYIDKLVIEALTSGDEFVKETITMEALSNPVLVPLTPSARPTHIIPLQAVFDLNAPDDREIVTFEFLDSTDLSETGHFYNHVTQVVDHPDHKQGAIISVPSENLTEWSFQASEHEGIEKFHARVFDGHVWGAWAELRVIVNRDADNKPYGIINNSFPDQDPSCRSVPGRMCVLAGGLKYRLLDLISVVDIDEDGIEKIGVTDESYSSDSGHIRVLGHNVSPGREFVFEKNSFGSLDFVSAPLAGSDFIVIKLFDGASWGQHVTINIVSLAEDEHARALLDSNGFRWNYDHPMGTKTEVSVEVKGDTQYGMPPKQAVQKALDTWAQVCGLSFTVVVTSEDEVTVGDRGDEEHKPLTDITMASYPWGPEIFGVAYKHSGPPPRQFEDVSVEIWMDSEGDGLGHTETVDFSVGSARFAGLLRTIGLALGLKYPNEDQHDPPYMETSHHHSVMDTRPHPYAVAGGIHYETPMIADVLAIQYLYGENKRAHIGDTIYKWMHGMRTLTTLWDSGGIDTIDCSNQHSVTIDLREGFYSSIGTEHPNLGIAFGTIIENAVGGHKGDRIVANEIPNELTGNGGADVFVFPEGTGNGDIILDFEPHKDKIDLSGCNVHYIVREGGVYSLRDVNDQSVGEIDYHLESDAAKIHIYVPDSDDRDTITIPGVTMGEVALDGIVGVAYYGVCGRADCDDITGLEVRYISFEYNLKGNHLPHVHFVDLLGHELEATLVQSSTDVLEEDEYHCNSERDDEQYKNQYAIFFLGNNIEVGLVIIDNNVPCAGDTILTSLKAGNTIDSLQHAAGRLVLVNGINVLDLDLLSGEVPDRWKPRRDQTNSGPVYNTQICNDDTSTACAQSFVCSMQGILKAIRLYLETDAPEPVVQGWGNLSDYPRAHLQLLKDSVDGAVAGRAVARITDHRPGWVEFEPTEAIHVEEGDKYFVTLHIEKANGVGIRWGYTQGDTYENGVLLLDSGLGWGPWPFQSRDFMFSTYVFPSDETELFRDDNSEETSEDLGEGVKTRSGCTCKTPWTYKGQTYYGCHKLDDFVAWCYVLERDCGQRTHGWEFNHQRWDYCASETEDLESDVNSLYWHAQHQPSDTMTHQSVSQAKDSLDEMLSRFGVAVVVLGGSATTLLMVYVFRRLKTSVFTCY